MPLLSHCSILITHSKNSFEHLLLSCVAISKNSTSFVANLFGESRWKRTIRDLGSSDGSRILLLPLSIVLCGIPSTPALLEPEAQKLPPPFSHTSNQNISSCKNSTVQCLGWKKWCKMSMILTPQPRRSSNLELLSAYNPGDQELMPGSQERWLDDPGLWGFPTTQPWGVPHVTKPPWF